MRARAAVDSMDVVGDDTDADPVDRPRLITRLTDTLWSGI
jgi:hypothetical protein